MTTPSQRNQHLRRRRDRGSAVIEFVGLAPLILVIGLVAMQVFGVIYAQSAASQAARDAARARSLGDSYNAAAEASLPGGVTLVSAQPTDENGVTVTVEAPQIVFLTDRTVTRTVIMP